MLTGKVIVKFILCCGIDAETSLKIVFNDCSNSHSASMLVFYYCFFYKRCTFASEIT